MSDAWCYANTWTNEIVPVQVEKFTDSSVWVDGRRRARRTTSEIHAPTWDEVHSFLSGHWESEIKSARARLDYMTGKAGNVKGLKRPTLGKGEDQ
jgi:hypothetical protein